MSGRARARVPLLLWGDLVQGSPPVLRRALAGARAHECMYAWVYLTDYLALERLLGQLLEAEQDAPGSTRGLLPDALWERFERASIDPYQQLAAADFEIIAHAAAAAAAADERRPLLVELGPAFLGARLKFEITTALARTAVPDWPKLEPEWVGIESSPFMRDAIRALHRDADLTLLEDYRELEPSDRFAILYSRFVSTYAFASSTDFGSYLADRFSVVLIDDAFSTTREDVPVWNHGQPEVFFSAPRLFGLLEERGFEVHVLDAYPDHPAGAAPCHVVRYAAVRRGLLGERYLELLRQLGFPLVPAETRARAGDFPERLNAAVSRRKWRRVERAKRASPVWGPTPEGGATSRSRELLRALRGVYRSRGWRHYRLRGRLARDEIERAVLEEPVLEEPVSDEPVSEEVRSEGDRERSGR